MAKLDETELTAIVAGELRDAINFIDEEVGPLRAAATDYYFPQPLNNTADHCIITDSAWRIHRQNVCLLILSVS